MKKIGFVVFVFTVLLFVSSSLSSSSTEELEGTLEIIMATKVSEKKCQPLYFINNGGKKTRFSLPAHAPPLSPGQKIKISGRWEESNGEKRFRCRKITSTAPVPIAKKTISSADSVSDYLPKQTLVLGEQRTLVILLHFTNHNTPEWGKEKAENKVFASEPTNKYPNDHSDNAFLKECSSEKTWLTGECLDGWKDMPYPATDYGHGGDGELDFLYELQVDAINATDHYVDYTKYNHILFVRTGDNWRYNFSTLGSKTIKTDDGEVSMSLSFVSEGDIELDRDYVAHELVIHGILGLIHANNIDIFTGEINEYGDRWDNRGAKFTLIDGLHKYMTGLLSTDQIILVESSGEYWLDQRELDSSGTKLLVIFLGYDNNKKPILYYLEYFKELGEFDSQVFDNDNPDENKDAVLLRKYKKENTYDSVVYVTNGRGGYKIKVLDLESQEFCDSDYENLEGYGVCVQVLEKNETDADAESRAKVKITLTSDYSFPTPNPPSTPTPSPTPTPTSTPTPTPTPCKPDIIRVSPNIIMNLKRKTSGEATVTITSANGCAIEGETVVAEIISAKSKKLVSVSPSSGDTDENGQAVFIITANKKTGRALVSFRASSLESLMTVKISRK